MAQRHFLTSNFRVAFEEYFDPEQQRKAVDTLQAHILEVQDGSEEQRRALCVLKEQDTTPEQIEQRLAAYLDKCHWQLAQFFRYSVPCRIAEAEPSLREVVRYAHAKDLKRDVVPELFLAVAISKVPEKEQEALSLFESAFRYLGENAGPALGPRSELWARATWARLLRRLDRVGEAEEQERAILYVDSVSWIVAHPLVFSAAKLRSLVDGDGDGGILDAITELPDVLDAIEKARERGRTVQY